MNDLEIENIFKSNKLNIIEKNLREMINSYKMTNDLNFKNNLKSFMSFILNYLENKVEIDEAHEFVKIMSPNITQLSNLFPEIFNDYIKKLLKELEEELHDEDLKENRNKITKIINSSLLIVFLTNKLNQPNQLLTNYILLINIYLEKFLVNSESEIDNNEEELNLLMKNYLIGVLTILSENTKSFNPNLFNHLEQVLDYQKEKLSVLKFDKANSHADLEVLKEIKIIINETDATNHNDKKSNPNLIIKSFYKILTIIESLIKNFKDDINFDILFKNLILIIFQIKHNIDKENKNEKIHRVIELYEDYKNIATEKKNIEINFMTIKKKAIPSLEPEMDLSFLGPNFVNQNAKSQRVAKAIQKKIGTTKKQAIRNLKKEAKIIDVQRQKVRKRNDDKRREDMKQSNQFIEQTNIEYKKLVTSQPKKRFKIKKMRGKAK